jgi:hypothetical protein
MNLRRNPFKKRKRLWFGIEERSLDCAARRASEGAKKRHWAAPLGVTVFFFDSQDKVAATLQ